MFEFITEMELIDVIVICILWVLSVVVSTVLMWTFVIPKFLRNIILDMISEPTPKTEKAVQSLAQMIINTPIDTGRMIKNEDGREVHEIIPLLTYVGREAFSTIAHKMSAAKGGLNKKANDLMAEAVAQSGGDPKALLPVALNAATRGDYGPLLMIVTQQLMNKPKGDTSFNSGGEKW